MALPEDTRERIREWGEGQAEREKQREAFMWKLRDVGSDPRAWTSKARPSGRRKSSGTWPGRENRPPTARASGGFSSSPREVLSLSGFLNLYAAAQHVVLHAVRRSGRWAANPVWRSELCEMLDMDFAE